MAFGRSKEERNALLSGPPIPVRPERNPETAPPVTAVMSLRGSLSDGFISSRITYAISAAPRTLERVEALTANVSLAPAKLAAAPGMPNPSISLQLTPFLKRINVQMSVH